MMSEHSATHDSSTPTEGPLAGVVVADFSRVLAGPYCTMLLADLGATVIKVEAPSGDETRTWKPPMREGISTYYLSVNRNKRSMVLDLTEATDLQTAYDLLDRADVFIENFKAGGLQKFGLDPDSVAKRWPHLVHASITGFGTAGGAKMPGYDLLVQAMSGMMSLTGEPDGDPQRSGVAIFDIMTGLHAAVAILAGLREKDRSGLGQHAALNLFSSALSGLANQSGGYAAAGNVPTRMGNDHPSLFPYGPFHASDGPLIICCGNDAQFSRLVTALGTPDLATDPRFETMSQRNANREELRVLLEEALAADTAENWADVLGNVGLPCGPILGIDGGVQLAEDLGLNPIVTMTDENNRERIVPVIANPMSFSRSPISYRHLPPELGDSHDWALEFIRTTEPKNPHHHTES